MDILSVIVSSIVIPVFWLGIFYPVLRKLGKSRNILAINLVFISLVTLAVKELFFKKPPDLFAMAVSGPLMTMVIICIYTFFAYGSRWLKNVSDDLRFFKDFAHDNDVPLRYVFQCAILIEEEGRKFYEKLAGTVQDINAARLFEKLAKDEEDHRQVFKRILNKWLPLQADKTTMGSLINALKKEGLFNDNINYTADITGILEYAIKQEELTVKFYSALKSTFPSGWKRLYIRDLIDIERSHADDLLKIRKQLSN